MYSLLVRLMILAAFIELGFSLKDFNKCTSKQCLKQIERAAYNVLRIDWKPISVWPEEAKKFREMKSCLGQQATVFSTDGKPYNQWFIQEDFQ